MSKDFTPSADFCKQLDELLLEKLGEKFTISRDSNGTYHFHDSHGHIHCVHPRNCTNKISKKRGT